MHFFCKLPFQTILCTFCKLLFQVEVRVAGVVGVVRVVWVVGVVWVVFMVGVVWVVGVVKVVRVVRVIKVSLTVKTPLFLRMSLLNVKVGHPQNMPWFWVQLIFIGHQECPNKE